MPLLKTLMERPSALPKASQYTVMNGVLYMASGLTMLLMPDVLRNIYMETAFIGREEGLVRLVGMMLTIIGWFYFFGGRTGARQIVAASIIDRVILVPVVLVPLALIGVFPKLMFSFAVLDPLLAMGAWYLLRKDT
jgi:hypothetical protein